MNSSCSKRNLTIYLRRLEPIIPAHGFKLTRVGSDRSDFRWDNRITQSVPSPIDGATNMTQSMPRVAYRSGTIITVSNTSRASNACKSSAKVTQTCSLPDRRRYDWQRLRVASPLEHAELDVYLTEAADNDEDVQARAPAKTTRKPPAPAAKPTTAKATTRKPSSGINNVANVISTGINAGGQLSNVLSELQGETRNHALLAISI